MERFTECLQSLLVEHQALLELAERKREILIRGPIKELTTVVAHETSHVNRVRVLEEERQRMFSSLTLGLSMKEWIEQLEEKQDRDQLEKLRAELKTVLFQLKQANDLNQQLIQQSQAYIQHNMELLTGEEKMVTYQRPMHPAANRMRTGFFNRQA